MQVESVDASTLFFRASPTSYVCKALALYVREVWEHPHSSPADDPMALCQELSQFCADGPRI